MKLDCNDTHKHHPFLGIILVSCACLSNAAMATMVKLISLQYSLPNQILVFARFSISFLLLLPVLFIFPKYRPLKQTLKINLWPPHALRIVFGLLSIYAYFYAIQKICLSNAVLLTHTSPLFIPFVLWIWRGVVISKRLWPGLLIGFIGTFLIVGPKIERFHVGYIIGLISGMTAAVSYVAARLLSYSEKPIAINFYLFLVTSVISFAFCAKSFLSLISSFDTTLWLYLLLMGGFGALFQSFIILALKWAQVRFLSAFLYLTVVFAMLLDWIVFHNPPCNRSIVGLLLVGLGAFLMTLLDPMRRKSTQRVSSD